MDQFDPSDAIFSETFASSSQGSFTLQNVVIDAAFVLYVGSHCILWHKLVVLQILQNIFTESWLISPDIDLSNKTAATLTFSTCR